MVCDLYRTLYDTVLDALRLLIRYQVFSSFRSELFAIPIEEAGPEKVNNVTAT
jgi:hypothetical protein